MKNMTYAAQYIPLILLNITLSSICYLLAKEKGKNIVKFTVFGCIPIINFYILIYLIGTPNRITEDKIDRILSFIDKN